MVTLVCAKFHILLTLKAYDERLIESQDLWYQMMKTDSHRHHHYIAALLVALALLLLATRPAWGSGGMATTVEVTADYNDPSEAGYGFPVFVRVSAMGEPTGTVVVSDGVDQCQFELPATGCILVTNTPGERALVADYLGDADFASSTSSAVTHTVLERTRPEILSRGKGLGFGWNQGNDHSYAPSVSEDGRYVAFHSVANNLVNGDKNGRSDVFLLDRQTRAVRRLSIGVDGEQSNNHSYAAAVSGDGQSVVFVSEASNLVTDDDNGASDVFLYSVANDTLKRVSVSSAGDQGNGNSSQATLSADGSRVAFASKASNLVRHDTNIASDVFVHHVASGTTERISLAANGSEANDDSKSPAISFDGDHVIFVSRADNLVIADQNYAEDAFVVEIDSGAIERVSVAADGSEADRSIHTPSISADGSVVAFVTRSSTLVPGVAGGYFQVYRVDRLSGEISHITAGDDVGRWPALSGDGQRLVFSSATDTHSLLGWRTAVYSYDHHSGEVTRLGRDVFGGGPPYDEVLHPAVSADGQFVAWEAPAGQSNSLGSTAIRTLEGQSEQETEAEALVVSARGSIGDGPSQSGPNALSANGQWVAFQSRAQNLAVGQDTDQWNVYLRDQDSGEVILVSANRSGVPANADSLNPAISASGRYVAFESRATDLVAGDSDAITDIFVYDRLQRAMRRVSPGTGEDSTRVALSTDGQTLAFEVGSDDAPAEIWSYDAVTQAFQLLSSNGYQVSLSGNGRYAAFRRNNADNTQSGVVVVSTISGQVMVDLDTTRLDGFGAAPEDWLSLSSDGRLLAFTGHLDLVIPSLADMPRSYTDVFVIEMKTQAVTLISRTAEKQPGNGNSRHPSLSADGRYLAYSTRAENLTGGTTEQVVVADVNTGRLHVISTKNDVVGNGDSNRPSLSTNNRFVAFTTVANNLVLNDLNISSDVMLGVQPFVQPGLQEKTDGQHTTGRMLNIDGLDHR